MIRRVDWRDGKLASHMRGCDAIISYDDGATWNLDLRFILDEWEYLRPDAYWIDGMCGHTGCAVLDDGHILTVYGNYVKGAAVLIKWKPDAN